MWLLVDERLVSKETVLPCEWGSPTLKFTNKQIDKNQIFTVNR